VSQYAGFDGLYVVDGMVVRPEWGWILIFESFWWFVERGGADFEDSK
jgi:hypothetical protein